MGSIHLANPGWTPGLNPQDFLNHLSVECGASPHTIAIYQRDLQRCMAYLQILGRGTLVQVTEVDLEGFVRALGDGFASFPPLGSTSVRCCLAAARSWHRYLFDLGSLGANVASSVKPAKLPRRLPEILNLEEMEALLAAMSSPGDSNSLRDRALLEFLYASGAHISKAMNLVLDDIDSETEPALMRLFGKGRKERISMLGRWACQTLQAYLVRVRPMLTEKGQSIRRVFLNTYGKLMPRQTAWAIIQAAAKRAQIDRPVHLHTLRHCFATHLLRGGADIRVVQELLGHALMMTAEIYMKVSKQMLLEAYVSTHPRARFT